MNRALCAIVCLGLWQAAAPAAADTAFNQGEQAEEKLRIFEARDLFRQALRETPDAPGVAEHTAWFLFVNGFRDEECRDLLRRAAGRGQEPAAMERAARQVERDLGLRPPADAQEREEERAFHRARIALAAKGTDEQLGGALVDAGDFAKGIPLLEKAAAANPRNAPLALRLARAYSGSGKLADADAAYEKLVEQHPGNALLLLESAQVAANRGQLERARRLLVAANEARADEPRIVRERARVEALLAKPKAAAAPENLPPPGPPRVFKQGEQAEKELRIYEARDLFRQAVLEDPDAPGVAEHTAWFLFLNGFHDEECRDLLRRAAPGSQEPAAMERAARHVERALGLRPPADAEEKEAKRAFDRVMIEKARTGSDADLGGALVDAGEYAEGIPLLERALAADPANAPLGLRLARAYAYARRQAEADAAYCGLLARQPDNPALLIEQAGVAAGRKMHDRACSLLAAAERARPGDARILLERSRVEAVRVERRAALAAIERMSPHDRSRPAAVLARARAEHYSGQFGPGRDGYIATLAAAPHLEEAAHGLAECRMRRGEIGSADRLLGAWMPRERSLDWRPRTDLFDELTDPRHGAKFSTYSNSLSYFEYGFGLDTRFHVSPETEIRPALVNSLFTQSGFTSIDRQGGLVDVVSRPEDWIATTARLGVNGYTNAWVTPVGGAYVEIFPVHWLDIGGGAEFFNLVDFQPPFGIGIYDIVTTIGAAGEKISSTQGTLHARLRPWAGWTLYARARVASFTDGNQFHDDFGEVAYELRPAPVRTRLSWAFYYLTLRDEAPLYQPVPTGPSTSAYYSPAALAVSSWNIEMSGRPRDFLEVGGEGHLYHVLENSGLGVGIFLYAKRELGSPLRVLRLDARYFTQNRGLTRQTTSAGSYDALNFLVTYDRRY